MACGVAAARLLSRLPIFRVVPDAEMADAEAFVKRVLADNRVDFPRAVVLDVGVTAGRGWAVVEQNAAWGSGVYGCDPLKVLADYTHPPVLKRIERLRQTSGAQ